MTRNQPPPSHATATTITLLATLLLLTTPLAAHAASTPAPESTTTQDEDEACEVQTDAPDKTGINCFETPPPGLVCAHVLWGLHSEAVTIGGNHSCNAQAWINASHAATTANDACTVHTDTPEKTGINCFETPPPGMGCAQVLWGIHTDTATVGGNHSCNVQAWTNAEAAS